MLRKSKITKEEIINLYNQGATAQTIAVTAEVSDSAILGILRRNNVTRRQAKRQGYSSKIKENIFNADYTKAHAYFLGLIAADGCAFERNGRYVFTLELSTKDIELLERFADFIELERSAIKTYSREGKNPTSRITIYSKTLVESLFNLNIKVGKSKSMNLLLQSFKAYSPQHLIRYWYAGFFDGDGTANSKVLSLTAESKSFLESVKIELSSLLHLNPDSLKIYQTGPNTYQLSFNRKLERIKTGAWLYKNNSLALSRKAHFYREIEVNIPELNWNPGMGIRTEGSSQEDQGQRIEAEKI